MAGRQGVVHLLRKHLQKVVYSEAMQKNGKNINKLKPQAHNKEKAKPWDGRTKMPEQF